MSTITDLLINSLTDSHVNALSEKIGGTADGTKKALGLAVPMLMGVLGKQNAQGGGLSGIMAMLDQNNNGSVIDDLLGFIQGGSPESHNNMVGNLLGEKRTQVESQIGAQAGLE